MHLQTQNYYEANINAIQALDIAKEENSKRSLPSFILGLAEVANPNITCTDEIIQNLRVAFYHEPSNKLIPIMTAACLDRMMYRYHYGNLDIEHLKSFLEIITNSQLDKKVAAPSLEIFITRCLIELKRNKQDFYIVMSDKAFVSNKDVIEELQQRLVRHERLASLLYQNTLPKVGILSKYFPKESKITTRNLASLVRNYIDDVQNITQELNLIENEFSTKSASKTNLFSRLFSYFN